jgi:hypothetical protein
MKILAKLLYWKLCFPKWIGLFPTRLRIVSGPFRGMQYTAVACGSAHSAKLLGTYEKELHAIIDEILAERFDEIIDVGAAEGYYAVGLACSSSALGGTIAFEAQEHGRQLLQELAARNNVKNLDIRSLCDVASLENALAGGHQNLVICDVEGFEIELLDPDRVPALLRCSILVELHDSPGVPISDTIRQRFAHSHRIQEVPSVGRTWEDFPSKNLFARLLPRYLALRAMNEARPPQAWFWMRPASRPHPSPPPEPAWPTDK